VLSVRDDLDQEAVANVMAESKLMAVPVVDAEGRIKGIVTVDDIVDVVREEATEDIQKIGGTPRSTRPTRGRASASWSQARGLAHRAVLGELLTANRDGLLRGCDRARRGARAVHPADHLERRQLGLAGEHAGDPRARDG
jgi:magnesium transporter